MILCIWPAKGHTPPFADAEKKVTASKLGSYPKAASSSHLLDGQRTARMF